MQLPFETSATVRAVDLDRDRRMSPGAWLRLFEQARWESWLASGQSHDGPARDRLHFVVRAQHLALGPPVAPGDALHLDVLLHAVGTTSLTMGQRAVRVSDGAEVARATLVAVMMGADGRPTPVPAPVRAQVTPADFDLPHMPEWGPPPSECWAATIRTRRSDLDLLQHVNQARYADLVLDAVELACDDVPDLAAMRLDYDHEVREHLALEFIGWPLSGGVHRVLGRVGEQVCVRATLWER